MKTFAQFFSTVLFMLSSTILWANESGSAETHSSDMSPLLFIILALLTGAGIRHFLKKTPLPYTVLLLIFGMVLGAVDRTVELEAFHMPTLSNAIEWAGHIDPHVILFVFLPTLIFEAAFAMDVHTFKRNFSSAVLLAVPGILLAMFLTASAAIGLKEFGIGLSQWDWSIALMFGAVISATDPVAVVSLLKELGASKKLGTLIEGESLLNDGTAIVIFMSFFLFLTGNHASSSPIVEFLRVSAGGVFIGIIVAWGAISWVGRVFNDALVEISLLVASAYLTFFVAEHFLHVSGVLALVAFGLMMASIGRTRISPEVEHFLHEFWELAAFIANTLIFIIVGVVISSRSVFTANDFLILGLIYLAINLARIAVLGSFYPIMKKIGYGMNAKDATVLWWGALRGAIGLALALVVEGASSEHIPAEIKQQFLFYTAGIVTLTLLVNATTIGWLVGKLGLTKMPLAKQIMAQNASKYLRSSAENTLARIKSDRYMKKADWSRVETFLPDKPKNEITDSNIDTLAETRRLMLEKEKSSYWEQFKEGMIGPLAVRRLSDTIDEILDEDGKVSLSKRADLEEMWKTSKRLTRLQNIPVIGNISKRLYFDRMVVSYDSARAFVEAQEQMLKLLDSMIRSAEESDEASKKVFAVIEEEIYENKIQGQTFLRNLRKNLPEIYNAITTRQAIRSVLNYERHTIERLHKSGRIGSDETKKLTARVEAKMKNVMNTPIQVSEVATMEVLRSVPMLRSLTPGQFEKAINAFDQIIFSVGEDLIKEHIQGDSIIIITRGTVKVKVDKDVVAILGPGSIVGEISFLTGGHRNATITAEAPVTALRMGYPKIEEFFGKQDFSIKDELWELAGKRIAKDLLNHLSPFSGWVDKKFEKWLQHGQIFNPVEKRQFDTQGYIAVLLTGSAFLNNRSHTEIHAPAVIDSLEITLSYDGRIFIADYPEEENTTEYKKNEAKNQH